MNYKIEIDKEAIIFIYNDEKIKLYTNLQCTIKAIY